MNDKRTNRKRQTLIQFALLAGILLGLNILANARYGGRPLYFWLDFTEEKRYTLTEPTRELLQALQEPVTVKILLDGEFPAGFKRLQRATQDLLDDFRGVSGYIEYAFEDPQRGSREVANERVQQLAEQGLIPVNLTVKTGGEQSQRIIFPYAIVYFQGRSMPVRLLENQVPGMPQEVVLNNSVGLLEYKFANALQKLQNYRKPPIAFTSSHGELDPLQTADLEKDLRAFYETGRIHLDSLVSLDNELAALVVAKPTRPFPEEHKFKIDQYIMRGGKVLWLIDALRVDLDSLRGVEQYVPLPYELNLEDLFFRYGFRIPPNLVLDMQCSTIPQVTGMLGNAPQFEYKKYPYHPVVTAASDHPIVKGLNPVNLFYPSSIDTAIRTKTPVEKTVLLSSSPRSRLQYVPITMDFEFLRYELDPARFDQGPQPVALMLEGVFSSMYENRIAPGMQAGLDQLGIEYLAESPPSAMAVVSDGDVTANPVNRSRGTYQPLGYNPYDRYQFANKDFIINTLEYLIDQGGVIEARGKEVRLRLLDRARAQEEKVKWQLINVVAPLVFLLLFGAAYQYIRRRRYT